MGLSGAMNQFPTHGLFNLSTDSRRTVLEEEEGYESINFLCTANEHRMEPNEACVGIASFRKQQQIAKQMCSYIVA